MIPKNSLALWVSDTSTAIGHLHEIKAMGFDRLNVCLVKHHVPEAYPYQPNSLAQLLTGAASIGMPVDGWVYGYPNGVDQQISTIAAILNAHTQIENCTLDFEGEWEHVSGDLGSPAHTFPHNLATDTNHRVALYLSSFDNPSGHPLPYPALLSHCAGFMPQSYQVDNTPVHLVMERTVNESAPLAAGSLGKEFKPTVNSPATLSALAAAPGTASAVSVWCWDGGGVDMGVRGHEQEWASAIKAYKATFV